ncbi:hypothetical protein [uncultured Duncaniella sp.]|uniref:hypothetical protein n=1 Tax=uncultured Duncaniella sp. TaxID=2768039 RepID=UPI00263A4285|nr:hypothetical protein [uncultured Duncaniella sp.]
MADNYLERRMEEYRTGRLASHSKSTPGMRRPHKQCELVLSYPPMNVIVIGPCDTLATLVTATVSAFTGVGSKVAFTSGDPKGSSILAQRTGARYYPSSFTLDAIVGDIAERWGDIDVVVDLRIIGPENVDGNTAADTASAARHILYLSHPDNTWLCDEWL